MAAHFIYDPELNGATEVLRAGVWCAGEKLFLPEAMLGVWLFVEVQSGAGRGAG